MGNAQASVHVANSKLAGPPPLPVTGKSWIPTSPFSLTKKLFIHTDGERALVLVLTFNHQ